jgi:hypothetical protein
VDPRIAVGHREHGALGAGEDRADALAGAGLDQRVAREAEQVLDTLALEDAGDRGVALHGMLPFMAWVLPIGSRGR